MTTVSLSVHAPLCIGQFLDGLRVHCGLDPNDPSDLIYTSDVNEPNDLPDSCDIENNMTDSNEPCASNDPIDVSKSKEPSKSQAS